MGLCVVNGTKNILILVLVMVFFAGATMTFILAHHLITITRINRRIEMRIAGIDSWLDDAIKESFQNLDNASR